MAMSPLRRVKEMVGGVDSWPTYIVLDMFVVESNALVKKKVAGFMYGNEVPVETAADCCIACRGQQYSREIKEALYSWYDTFDTHTRNRQNVDYWNMRSKRLLWLNGKELAQDETLKPKVTVMESGVEPIRRIFREWWWAVSCAIEYILAGKRSNEL
jgi:hypothetical protein